MDVCLTGIVTQTRLEFYYNGLVVSRGTTIGGAQRSWSVPVYILDGEFPDAFPADEDSVPMDGEPHLEHLPLVMRVNPQPPNWEFEQQGAAQNLGVFGGNPHLVLVQQFHPIQFQAALDGNADEDEEEGIENMDVEAEPEGGQLWQPWDPTIFVADNDQNQQQDQLPEHPAFPQHIMELNLYGSSMRFLRANGPDIAIEEVMHPTSDDSSSTSDAASKEAVVRARFNAVRSLCAKITMYHRKDIPGLSDCSIGSILMRPIFVESNPPVHQQEALAAKKSGWEVVVWKPQPAAAALLNALPFVLDKIKNIIKLKERQPTWIIDSEGTIYNNLSVPMLPSHDITMGESDTRIFVTENIVSMIIQSDGSGTDTAATMEQNDNESQNSTNKHKRKGMMLPDTTSLSDTRTPLTERVVWRSPRLSNNLRGNCQVRIDKEPSRRAENWILERDEATGKYQPISISTLQG